VTRRARELGIRHVTQGVADKAVELRSLASELGVTSEEIACVGDDTPDLPMLRLAGLAIAVADAHPALQTEVHWVTKAAGGRGAVREVCDLLLSARAR
jgi:3-deoxy-D-manno-octulosonate 8-phosphate phosphatase (KDO 8-P phosphatase)